MDCKAARLYMHNQLDGDLSPEQAMELKAHLAVCGACRIHYKQLETTEALIRFSPKLQTSSDLTARILQSLPPARKRGLWFHWIKRHPAVSVAAVFMLVMFGSFLSLWNEDSELMVKGPDLDQVVIQGNTVLVPAGHTVEGNLIVKSGKIQVDGDVKGNITVIDGSVNMASTAHISGQINQVNQGMEWIWFKLQELYELFSK